MTARYIVFILISIAISLNLLAENPPFNVLDGLFDQSLPNNLGLEVAEGTETITIYAACDSTDKYCNGAVMVGFKGSLYCQWQSSAMDEDSEDTWVAYSCSRDGIHWSEPMVLSENHEDTYCTSGGWWVYGDTLVAFINEWNFEESPRYCQVTYILSTDGENWTDPRSVLWADGSKLIGAFEQDPKVLSSGRIINALHISPGLHVTPVFTNNPLGVSGWHKGDMINMAYKGDVTREIEPSSFMRKDGALVMVFRDQKSSYCKLASVSLDEGQNWSTPVITNMPDSRSKQSAGNLPDGTAYFVSNPVNNKARMPLVLTLSNDGKIFDKAFVLCKQSDLPDMYYQGKFKRPGYHYPKSMIYNDYLYISYTTNKEKVEYSRVPLESLVHKLNNSKF